MATPNQPNPGTAPQSRRSRKRQWIVLSVFLVLCAGFFAFAWIATRHNAGYANVGDCMAQTGPNSLKIVKCDDASAAYKVVGRVDGKTQVDASMDACDAYTRQGAQTVYWQGTSGGKGLVLCLARKG